MNFFYKRFISFLDFALFNPLFSWLVKRLAFTKFVHGPQSRLLVSPYCSLVNTIFNTSSGFITIGSHTIFGHNCMVLTGRHNFIDGSRAHLSGYPIDAETPNSGQDISIGCGCWIASGAIILGDVSIGNNCIVCAGAVVTHSFSDNLMIAGVPAKVICKL